MVAAKLKSDRTSLDTLKILDILKFLKGGKQESSKYIQILLLLHIITVYVG